MLFFFWKKMPLACYCLPIQIPTSALDLLQLHHLFFLCGEINKREKSLLTKKSGKYFCLWVLKT